MTELPLCYHARYFAQQFGCAKLQFVVREIRDTIFLGHVGLAACESTPHPPTPQSKLSGGTFAAYTNSVCGTVFYTFLGPNSKR